MKIGFVGTGKLGLPVSLVYASKDHELFCYDINQDFYKENSNPKDLLYEEELCPDNNIFLGDWLDKIENKLKYKHVSMKILVENSDIIFVAIQTPHDKEYEGINRLPKSRKDFDYTYLINGIKLLSEEINQFKKDVPVVIISTVLPGTIRREIIPIINSHVKLCYNPYFIAMGTVAKDCLYPEFILIGNYDEMAKNLLIKFYKTITDSKVFSTTIENAELIKVCYNTFISTKIAMANTIMELCYNSPNTNCDDVMNALFLADKRLISTQYLTGGMGDGGGCHPRDNIALSWYSKEKCSMDYDWFEFIMTTREKQIDFLANIIEKEYKNNNIPIIILGISFKPDTSITTGSTAILLCNILKERKIDFSCHDPIINKNIEMPSLKAIYFIGCKHSIFKKYILPDHSILIDPHRIFKNMILKGKYIPIGNNIDLK